MASTLEKDKKEKPVTEKLDPLAAERDRLEKEGIAYARGKLDARDGMAGLLAHKQENLKFAHFVETQGEEAMDLMRRHALQEVLNPEDLIKLATLKEAYHDQMEKVKKVESVMTPDQIAMFAKGSIGFEAKVRLLGSSEKASKMLTNQMYELYERDPAAFQELHDKILRVEEFKKKNLKELNDAITAHCKKLKIGRKEFDEIMKIPDRDKRIAKLRPRIKAAYQGLKKFSNKYIDRADVVPHFEALKLENRTDEIKALYDELDRQVAEIGSFVNFAMDESPEMLEVLNREINNVEHPPKEEQLSHAEAQSAIDETVPTRDEMMSEWELFKAEEEAEMPGPLPFFETLNEQQKEAARMRFQKKMEGKRPELKMEKKGSWKNIFGGIFSWFFNDIKKDLK